VRRRRHGPSLAANPVLIGAATTLVVVVAVFLAYNANTGLPFVPTYRLQAEIPSAANLVKGNDVRIGGTRALIEVAVTVIGFALGGTVGPGTLAFNDFSGVGRPGTGTLKVDGKVVQTIQMPRTLPMILQWDESFDIGSDTLTGVNDADYTPPFALTAKLDKLTIKVDRPQLSAADIAKLEAAMKEKAKAARKAGKRK